ncbi:polysaccharide deacetylase family protein [Candidatus Venteria ishoeyi]|nr:polysaccharide deacetylase family protein [Candidatus Venteria ishoeyi]MDM8545393.1 polysaccharide deacetylase family protein [Candidatus Venteria ishoeyi]
MNNFIKLILALFYFVFDSLRRWLLNRPYPLVVLCYHEVTAKQAGAFQRQLQQILRHTQAVFADAPASGQTRQLAVSFDDGFANLLEHALPQMQAKAIPATLFIPTAALGQYPPWLQAGHHPNKTEILMTAEQLQNLSEQWVKIGSHANHHIDLTQLKSADLEAELQQSKTCLNTLLNKPVDLLAFPYGRYDNNVIQVARKTGYQRIFAADPVTDSDTYLLGRSSVYPEDGPLTFYLKIHGAYQWLPIAIAWKRRLKGLYQRSVYEKC